MSESAAPDAWGYYDMHSTPTHVSLLHSFDDPAKDIRVTRSPLPPLRTIRRTTCLHQLAGATDLSSLAGTAPTGLSSSSSATLFAVPPLPKHSPTVHTLPAMPASPLRDVVTGKLLEKVGLLRRNGETVHVALKHQWLSWQVVDPNTFQPVAKAKKQSALLTLDTAAVARTSATSWTFTNRTCFLLFGPHV
ncbi:Aste57867_8719 [Aphanomyces stellatus]|uniref:Aste57867_8719 protein n=1 Tax=Aphanomyces stellatus TaxID=120398 RepID=A0A485KKZ4_9STRA|nr:hypothetical protein As57867_008685 [Aphanomyces stellatus]VFT85605.1 Aste57867_8719 [Aphanomyces stellatus]